MPARHEWIGIATALVAAVVGAALAFPDAVTGVVSGVQRPLSAPFGGVPEPVLFGLSVLLVIVLWLLAMLLLGRGIWSVWKRIGGRVRWAFGSLWPETPIVKFAAGVMALIALTFVIVAVLPAVANLGTGGAAEFAQGMSEDAFNEEWDSIVEGDTASGEPVCSDRQVSGTDSDGDGLPDSWERTGETPGGAQLPDANATHKDLYVQLDHGSESESLDADERQQLREVWADMPVDNPDGTTGIDLHIVEGGGLGDTAVVESAGAYNRYYTRDHLGERLCVYHQVVYGQVELGDTVGYASMPGYAAVVDAERRSTYEGNVSFRVAVTTHELLHNVAGRVDGRPHTTEGWLRGGPQNEFLSAATERDLEETGLFGPAS